MNQTTLIDEYFKLLFKKNELINLVSRKIDKASFKMSAVAEAQILASCIDRSEKNVRGIDIGSGGGIPVVLLAILLPHKRFTAIEANSKKVKFIEQVTTRLELSNLEIFNTRAETLNVGLQYHFGIAKAVAHMAVLQEYFAPLIKIGGQIYLPKGASAETEIGEAARAAKIFGFELDFVLENEKDRVIVSYKKKRNPEIDLPRKIGEAKHRPIL